MMRRAACLHAKCARRYRRRPLCEAVEAEPPVEEHVSPTVSCAYHNDSLRKIYTNGGNLVHELPPGYGMDRYSLPSWQGLATPFSSRGPQPGKSCVWRLRAGGRTREGLVLTKT